MKAAVLEDLNRIMVKEVPTPEPDEESILMRVRACAVCGSDIRIHRHGNPRVKPPQVIGHEMAGEVVTIGSRVKKFKPGDRIATGADVPCGVCEFCQSGMGNNCPINYALGYQFPGGFAEYALFNETTVKYGPLHHIPAGLSFDEATLAEPLACCLNGLELSSLRTGESVVIIGAGPVGCLLVELARNMGAGKIILAQRSKERLEIARKFRADVFISTSEEDLISRVREETKGEGADVVITACASPAAQEQAISLVRNRGRVNFFGGLAKGSRKINVDSNIIHYKECFVHGAHGSVPRQHRVALELLAKGFIRASDFISYHFSLNRIHEAFDTAEKRKGMKVIVNP